MINGREAGMEALIHVLWAFGPLSLLGLAMVCVTLFLRHYLHFVLMRRRLFLGALFILPLLFLLLGTSIGIVGTYGVYIPSFAGVFFFAIFALIGMELAKSRGY